MSRIFNSYFVLHICVFIGVGVCQTLDVSRSRIESATAGLVDRFDKLKKYGLGVDRIEEEYLTATFSYSHLDATSIQDLISAANAQQAINDVLTTFNSITNFGGGVATYSNDCCNTSRDTSKACCYNCGGDDILLGEVAAEITNSGVDWAEFSVGFADGTLLRYPLSIGESCVDLDSRLMPWYVSATENVPREIVILLDLNQDGNSSNILSQAAIDIINSLSEADRIGLVIVATLRQQSCGTSTVYATSTVKNELTRVIEERFASEPMSYSSAFAQANNLFSNDISNQLFVLLTDGRRKFNCSQIMDCSSTREHVVYYVNDPTGGTILPGSLSAAEQHIDNIASYSMLFTASGNVLSDEVICTTSFNSNGVSSLSLTRLWQNGSDTVGVLNVLLPWNRLLWSVFDAVAARPSSYVFTLSNDSTVLYHDSIPDLIPIDINLEKVEGSLPMIKNALAMGNDIIHSTSKSYHLPQSIPGSLSFIKRSIPVTYVCSNFAVLNTGVARCSELYACVVLAEEDSRIITDMHDVTVQDIYSDASRLPEYHSTSEILCKEYCYESSKDRLGLQLVYPLQLPSNFSITEIKQYISGTGTRPSYIPSNVNIASMTAIASVAAVAWTADDEQSVVHRIPINKRHFALPAGVYLSLPYVQLNSAFAPQYTNWYRSAMAFEDSVTLSAADQTPVGGATVYYASTTVKNQFNEVVGVVAAELTEESLFIDVNNVLDGLCNDRDYTCTIINSNGLYVLRPPLSSRSPDYLGQQSEYNSIFRELLREDIVIKAACDDLKTDHSFHVFYQIKSQLYNAECFNSGTNDCRHICIQRINGTDSYLLVFKDTCGVPTIAFCNEICTSCPNFIESSPECPCSCNENRCDNPTTSFDACSISLPPHNYNIAASADMVPPQIGFCNNRSECCSYDQNNCLSSPLCSWCSDENKCLPLGVCCDGTTSCCSSISSLPACFRHSCVSDQGICPNITEPTPTTTSTSPINNTQAAIIGGVLGGLFAIFLVALLVVCFVWYQFFRTPDAIDDKSKTYIFDDVRIATSNKTAIELKEVESTSNAVNGNEKA